MGDNQFTDSRNSMLSHKINPIEQKLTNFLCENDLTILPGIKPLVIASDDYWESWIAITKKIRFPITNLYRRSYELRTDLFFEKSPENTRRIKWTLKALNEGYLG